jgi:DNA-binding response OmpR family regulator
MNGYQLYQCVVENPRWVAIPFLFLTAQAQDSDIRYGKELGADDYLTKPFDTDDLMATVRGRLRRSRQCAQQNSQQDPRQLAPGSPHKSPVRPSPGTEVLTLGRLKIDSKRRRVWLNDSQIKLSSREFMLLQRLAWRSGEVVPLQELIHVTHGLKVDHTEASGLLRPLIRSLRRKLGYQAGELGCIESVRGVGYQMVTPGDPL